MRHRPLYRESVSYRQQKNPKNFHTYSKIKTDPKSIEDQTMCVDCGWPIKSVSSPLFAGKTEDGVRQFRHSMCPSLKQRAELRRSALEHI